MIREISYGDIITLQVQDKEGDAFDVLESVILQHTIDYAALMQDPTVSDDALTEGLAMMVSLGHALMHMQAGEDIAVERYVDGSILPN